MSCKFRIIVGLVYVNDISFNSENSEEFVQGDLFFGFFCWDLFMKLMCVREGKVYYECFWKNGLFNCVIFLYWEMDFYGGIFFDGCGFNFVYLLDLG